MADNAEPEYYVADAKSDPGLDERVESLAQKLLRETDDNGRATDGSLEAARRTARRMLEESARTAEAYDLEPDDDHVIRRSSSETAASGDTGGTRWVSDGE